MAIFAEKPGDLEFLKWQPTVWEKDLYVCELAYFRWLYPLGNPMPARICHIYSSPVTSLLSCPSASLCPSSPCLFAFSHAAPVTMTVVPVPAPAANLLLHWRMRPINDQYAQNNIHVSYIGFTWWIPLSCQIFQPEANLCQSSDRTAAPLQPVPFSEAPWSKSGLDTVGPIEIAKWDCK